MTENLPDFLIVGAMKCGTSTLAAQLGAQAGIFMSTPKEPNFFSDDENYARGLAWYRELFASAAAGDLKGEASTHYTKLLTFPQTVPRLQQVLDAPKVIYLIRNPIDRAVSHYVHEWTMGVMSDDIEAEFGRHPDLVSFGLYGQQMVPWVKAFGAESILILTLDAMTRSPQAFLDRVGNFLGHKGPLVWQEQLGQLNASAERVRRLPLHSLLIDNPLATTLRRTLVPKSLRERIRRGRQLTRRPQLSQQRRRALEAIFAEDHDLLTQTFPACVDIASAYPFVGK
jgi:hypothetical protein